MSGEISALGARADRVLELMRERTAKHGGAYSALARAFVGEVGDAWELEILAEFERLELAGLVERAGEVGIIPRAGKPPAWHTVWRLTDEGLEP